MGQRDRKHHHKRSLASRLSLYLLTLRERCQSVWARFRFKKPQPRISSQTQITEDGGTIKRIKVVKSRATGNYFSFAAPKSIKYPILLLAIFILIMLMMFGEAYINRRQNISMTIGKWGAPAE